ncbi:MAG: two-component system, OmpR family, sensor kinase [Gaiellaceae bacterium]|nr:two-component system, OmpR family, sensor kinase [Gaiellaceae bacterium]
MRTPSLRRRVSLATVGLLALAIIVLDCFVYFGLSARLNADQRSNLQQRANVALNLYPSSAAGTTQPYGGPSEIATRLSGGGIAAVVGNANGWVSGLPLTTQGLDGLIAGTNFYRPAELQRALGRIPALRSHSDTVGGFKVLYVTSAAQIQRELSRLLVYLVGGSLLTLLLALLVLERMLRVTLKPLSEIAQVARRIRRGELGERVHPTEPATDLGTLGAALDEMLDSLEEALATSRRSEERMRRFLGDASHELRTPLAGVRVNVELLLRNQYSPEEQEVILLKLGQEVTRAARLVDDLLSIDKIDQGVPLEREAVDLRELARIEVGRAADLAPQLRFDLAVNGPAVAEVDPERIRQVVANLIDNACHASPVAGTVHVSVAREPGACVVEVEDEGAGVPVDERERIFERFVRLDPSRSRHRFGSGLGLSIARGLAEAHGGELVCLAGERGALFRLKLPAPATG